MSDYVEKEIALLDAHDMTDEEGNVLLSITPEMLQTIADNNNRLVRETGDETPIVIGHTKDELPQTKQPEIVGWARNFRVKQLFSTGRKAIFCTAKFFKDRVQDVSKFPRRSVELWLKRMLIDPISLLGATSPERHLGVLKFAGGEQTYQTLSPEEANMQQTDGNDDLVSKVISALEQTDVFKWVRQQMEADAGGNMPPDENDQGLAPPDQMAQDPTASVEEPPPEPVRQSAAAAPAGGNTFIPGADNDPAKVKMQADQMRGHLLRYQAAYQVAWDRVKELEQKVNRSERKADLIQLDAEGYAFDMAEELDAVVQLSAEDYQRHLNRIKTRYQRAPVGQPIKMAANGPKPLPGHIGGRTKEEADVIMQYACDHKMGYQEAALKLAGNQERVF